MKPGLACCAMLLGASTASAQVTPTPAKNMGGGNCSANPYNCSDAPNPIPTPNTIWFEEMTWMDVRDALAAGTTTIIIPTGGLEPNGPWLATGKHNYILQANCEAIARRLGNALCAPITNATAPPINGNAPVIAATRLPARAVNVPANGDVRL